MKSVKTLVSTKPGEVVPSLVFELNAACVQLFFAAKYLAKRRFMRCSFFSQLRFLKAAHNVRDRRLSGHWKLLSVGLLADSRIAQIGIYFNVAEASRSTWHSVRKGGANFVSGSLGPVDGVGVIGQGCAGDVCRSVESLPSRARARSAYCAGPTRRATKGLPLAPRSSE